ncbi:hypothetical protein [Streptomyces sp. C10-9-1]|uniref:hypothetical protein n=1 Tax=Streptomyces sp. C10-9-1 TaxID=1859285 RepID=UPI003F4A077E
MKRPRARRCPTGKFRHPDETAARMALQGYHRGRRPRRGEQTAYACTSCGGWHLTSER